MSEALLTPDPVPDRSFEDATQAVDYLTEIYERNTLFLRNAFEKYLAGATEQDNAPKVRACYPEVRFTNPNYADVDSRQSYGYVIQPGQYSTTITRPKLFRRYLIDQLSLLMLNHKHP